MKPGLWIRIRRDPHSFYLLDPDPGGVNFEEKNWRNARKLVPVIIVFLVKWSNEVNMDQLHGF